MRRRGPDSEPVRHEELRSWERQETPPSPGGKAELTIIGSGARLEGNLVSAGSLRIEGSVKGQITAEGDVIVAPGAEVSADIRASNVTVGGRYTGNVTANGTLELQPGARVDGNISCQSLVVNQGANFTGQSIMEGGVSGEPLREERAEVAADEED